MRQIPRNIMPPNLASLVFNPYTKRLKACASLFIKLAPVHANKTVFCVTAAID
jgi:hypothetical protein